MTGSAHTQEEYQDTQGPRVLGDGDNMEQGCCINGSSNHSHLSAELAHFHPPLKSKLGKETDSY